MAVNMKAQLKVPILNSNIFIKLGTYNKTSNSAIGRRIYTKIKSLNSPRCHQTTKTQTRTIKVASPLKSHVLSYLSGVCYWTTSIIIIYATFNIRAIGWLHLLNISLSLFQKMCPWWLQFMFCLLLLVSDQSSLRKVVGLNYQSQRQSKLKLNFW